eukprot:11165-Heterococcus_DN1.PRE.2
MAVRHYKQQHLFIAAATHSVRDSWVSGLHRRCDHSLDCGSNVMNSMRTHCTKQRKQQRVHEVKRIGLRTAYSAQLNDAHANCKPYATSCVHSKH